MDGTLRRDMNILQTLAGHFLIVQFKVQSDMPGTLAEGTRDGLCRGGHMTWGAGVVLMLLCSSSPRTPTLRGS